MNYDNKNFILAIVLSMLIIFGWQYFYAGPMLEKQQEQAEQAQKAQQQQTQGSTPLPVPGTQASIAVARDQALATTPRIKIETDALSGSINLRGAAIDDLHLKRYRETAESGSPTITLLSPSGTKNAYFAEQGWTPAQGSNVKVPQPDTVWQAPAGVVLGVNQPVTLAWDNGQGLTFKRTIAIDENYLFTITQTVENKSQNSVALHVYARTQRQGTPYTEGIWVLYEGPLGVLGGTEQRHYYSDLAESTAPVSIDSTGGWLGFTDKYWAVVSIPDQKTAIKGEFFHQKNGDLDIYQTHYLSKDAVTVPAGGTGSAESRLFAGAKVVQIIDAYQAAFGIEQFDLMIDWGWFYFLTKPLFYLLEYIKTLVGGNFGVAILIVTVLVKLALFPLANKSYASMSKMKKLQPEMEKIKERVKDDRMKMQQEMMELYKREKVSPVSGCLPILVQIPVFFALYKVIYTTIELRHAPFFGWIKDLSAGDPTSIFNLFGLIPWSPPLFLMIGVWPIIMGITMWMQMRLNPTPPDPIQASLFNWMPVIFTFMLATFPAGLVIYWAWNNFLSILQQSYIMKKHGVEINFFGNIRDSLPFLKKKPAS